MAKAAQAAELFCQEKSTVKSNVYKANVSACMGSVEAVHHNIE